MNGTDLTLMGDSLTSLAWRGEASVRLGEARHGREGGRLAGTGVQAPGVHARHRTARPGPARYGWARQGMGEWHTSGFESWTPTHGAGQDLERLGSARRGAVRQGRMGERHTPGFKSPAPALGDAGRGLAWQRVARRGCARRGMGWMGEWSTSEFESPTPTRGGARLGIAWRCQASPGAARTADGWQSHRVRDPGVHKGQRTTSPVTVGTGLTRST
jgi:hypothetical protein